MVPSARPESVERCIAALCGAGAPSAAKIAAAGSFVAACRALARRVASRPAHVRRNIAAIVHCLLGNPDRAIACLEDSLAAEFAQPEFQALFAELLMSAGRWDDYPRKGEFGLEIVAALKGLSPPPERYHPVLVGRLFDRLSPDYEERVLREGYAEHTRVAQAIAGLGTPGAVRVLDLGCGTGMLGEALRAAGGKACLIGVDASAAMLERARARAIYDELHLDDIAHFLHERMGARTSDAVGLASVIPFFGALDELFGGIAGALGRGTWVVFTFDVAEAEDVQFSRFGRFRHAMSHVDGVLTRAGFRVQSRERFTARREAGLPVPAMLVVARKIAD